MRYLVALLLLTPLLLLAQPGGEALATHECGHFLEGSTVRAGAIASAIEQGCNVTAANVTVIDNLLLPPTALPPLVDFSNSTFIGRVSFAYSMFPGQALFLGALFTGETSFEGVLFNGTANFREAAFMAPERLLGNPDALFNAAVFRSSGDFNNATFRNGALFLNTRFLGEAAFVGARFDGPTTFGIRVNELDLRSSRFADDVEIDGMIESLDMRGALLGSRLTFSQNTIVMEIRPPASITGATNLTWNNVKDYLPPGDRAEILRAWESFFASGGQPSSARQIRTIITHDELEPIIAWLIRAGLVIAAAYFVRYYYAFRRSPSTYDVRFRVKTFAFSLAVMAPIAKAWAYHWDHQFPTEQVSIATSIQSLMGWVLLAAGSALAVIWFTA